MKFDIRKLILWVIVLAWLTMAGCIEEADTPEPDIDPDTDTTDATQELWQEELTIWTPNWPGARVISQVAHDVLEEQWYDVEVNQLEPGIAYESLAAEEIDIMLAGWLPTTHQEFWDEVGEDIQIAGVNVLTTWLGLAVPDYVDEDIQSLEDLADEEVAETFDNTITWIDPEAGVMSNTETVMEEYGLEDYGWELESSSESAMMSSLNTSVSDEEPIIITAWEPHAMFNITELRQLEDAESIYNDPDGTAAFLEEHAPEYADEEVHSDVIASLTYNDFEEVAPAAYNLLTNLQVESDVQSGWIYSLQEEDMDPEEIAEEFIQENEDLVESWKN